VTPATRADELLERFRLAERADAFPMQISGGMAQRLQVARAIAHRPRLLFLDEPTAGLDPQSRIALWELVQELRADGLTVVLTTHYMEEADQLCDRVAIIDHGRVLGRRHPKRLKDRGTAATPWSTCGSERPPPPVLSGSAAVAGVTVGRAAPSDGVRLVTDDRSTACSPHRRGGDRGAPTSRKGSDNLEASSSP
jgi:ABC-2 type transport system ATP-binding protein